MLVVNNFLAHPKAHLSSHSYSYDLRPMRFQKSNIHGGLVAKQAFPTSFSANVIFAETKAFLLQKCSFRLLQTSGWKSRVQNATCNDHMKGFSVWE